MKYSYLHLNDKLFIFQFHIKTSLFLTMYLLQCLHIQEVKNIFSLFFPCGLNWVLFQGWLGPQNDSDDLNKVQFKLKIKQYFSNQRKLILFQIHCTFPLRFSNNFWLPKWNYNKIIFKGQGKTLEKLSNFHLNKKCHFKSKTQLPWYPFRVNWSVMWKFEIN